MSLWSVQPSQPDLPPPPRPAPLLVVAIGLVAGILLDNWLHIPALVSVIAIVAGSIAVLWRPAMPSRTIPGLIIIAAALGTMRHALADRYLPKDHIYFSTAADPILLSVKGRVVSQPIVTPARKDPAVAYELTAKTRFVIEAQELSNSTDSRPVTGNVAVVAYEDIKHINVGDIIRMTGWLRRNFPPRNPGSFDWGLYQHRNGIEAGFSCQHAESVIRLHSDQSTGWQGFINALRSRAKGYLLDPTFSDDDPSAGVLSAMVLGQRSEVPATINEAFIKTGNAHFLAASGTNIGWLAMMGWWGLMRIARVSYRKTVVAIAIMIVMFLLVAEPEPPILRAGIIGLIGCISIFFRRRVMFTNWLAASAVVILMIDPMDFFRPGFQFSFLAVIAVMALEPVLADICASVFDRLGWTELAKQFTTGKLYALTLYGTGYLVTGAARESRRSKLLGIIPFRLLTLSFSAWAITTPLSCYLFDTFTPWGCLGTLLLWIVAWFVTFLGFITMTLGAIFPPTGVILGPILGFWTHLMVAAVDLLARIPGTIISGRSPSLAWVIAVYMTLAAWLWSRQPQSRLAALLPEHWRRYAFKVLTIVLILWWLIPPRWAQRDFGALDVWMLAIGDGTATIIEAPTGQIILCDFGTRSGFDASIVGASFLKHRGIKKIDAAYISHPDFDHISGVAGLAKQFEIGQVIVNDQFDRLAVESPAAKEFLAMLKRNNIPLHVTTGRHELEGLADFKLESIWPPPQSEWKAPTPNDSSTVLRLEYQGHSVLLTADIAEAAFAQLLAQGQLKTDVLALPHHGSVVNNTSEFIKAVDPKIAVRSTAQARRLTTNEIERIVGKRDYLTTADDGCVLIQIRKNQLTAYSTSTKKVVTCPN
jgi:competence protein ComEC